MANKMQFRQPRWKISASRPKNFYSMSKNGKNLILCKKEKVSRLILWTKRKHLGQTFWIQIFADVGFRSMSENGLRNHFFSKVLFSSNFPVGHVECEFEFHVRNFSTIGQKPFAQSPITMETKIHRKNFPSKLSSGLRRTMQFWNPPWKLFWQPTAHRKFFAWCPKTIKS